MKRFDPLAIKQRMLSVLQQYDNWKSIQKDGAMEQLLEALAEPLAENARYGEYLLQELKWDTSRNFSSVKHMARLVGKKLARKHSAVGTVVISHSDVTGSKRYANLGVSNFTIDARSNYDNLEKDDTLTDSMYLSALVAWTDDVTYTVPQGATIKTTSGIPFICAETQSIQKCITTWDTAYDTTTSLESFRASGGWTNYKYLIMPVIQGVVTTNVLGTSDGTMDQEFTLATLDIEAADNYYTKQFCYAEVVTSSATEKWTEVEHLATQDSTSKVFEIEIRDDLYGTVIRFGDSKHGAIPSKDASIILHYIVTKGEDGNVTDLYQFNNTITGVTLPDTSTYENLSIGCQNMWPIIGGQNLETIEDFKENAETAYAKNYEILHTYEELIENINTISPVPLIKVSTQEFLQSTTLGGIKVYQYTIGVTGINTGLKALSTTEQNLFNNIMNNQINNKVLANRSIKYIAPSIVRLNTAVTALLTETVPDEEAFTSEIEDYLTLTLGKGSTDALEMYTETDVVSKILSQTSLAKSLQVNTLLTIDADDVDSIEIGADTDANHILIHFLSPDCDAYDNYDVCCKTEDDLEVPYLFNITINGTSISLIVHYKKTLTYVNGQATSTSSIVELVNPTTAELVELSLATNTLTTSEQSNYSSLTAKTTATFSDTYYKVIASQESVEAYMALDKKSVASLLGFSTPSSVTAEKVVETLQADLDNNTAEISLSYAPIRNFASWDWDTIVYYDNFDIEIE